LRLIAIQEVLNKNLAALTSTQDALKLFPQHDHFKTLAVYFYIINDQIDLANRMLKSLPRKILDSPIGKGLKGQLMLAKGESKEAIPNLLEYYNYSPTEKNSSSIARAYRNNNQDSEALNFLKTHQDKHEYSLLADLQIAELEIAKNRFTEAKKVYRSILSKYPQNIRAINNLAFILSQEGDFSSALPLANKAVALFPDEPAILDTLAMILKNSGDLKQALIYSEKAYAIDDKNPNMALSLTEILIANGQKDRAKEILNSITDTSPTVMSRVKLIEEKL
jgi:Flp pilus assembly protein TadD